MNPELSAAQRAAELSPGDPLLVGRLADLLARHGNTSGAERAYRRWLELAPDAPEAHSAMASCLAEQGRWEEAIEAAKRAVQIAPDNPYYQARLEKLSIPDRAAYQPAFAPWLVEYGEFREVYQRAVPLSLVGRPRCDVLYTLAKQALALTGEFWECGVYKGGTAAMLAETSFRNNGPLLRLFDTFAGMPETDPVRDFHKAGDFADTSLEAVMRHVGHEQLVSYHKGYIPTTFLGLEQSAISFAHVDVDVHQSILDCCEFIFPRLVRGGFMIFDDYGALSCPGARAAVDSFFKGTGVLPLVLSTGQAVVFKSVERAVE